MLEAKKWFRLITNLLIFYRFHRELKRRLKPNFRLDALIEVLKEMADVYHKKATFRYLNITKGIRDSTAQTRFKDFHPKNQDFRKQYDITNLGGQKFMVRKTAGEKVSENHVAERYLVEILPEDQMFCVTNECKVICEPCREECYEYRDHRLCAHRMLCTCQSSVYLNMCKHMHYVALTYKEEVSSLLSDHSFNFQTSLEEEEDINGEMNTVEENCPENNVEETYQVDNVELQPQALYDVHTVEEEQKTEEQEILEKRNELIRMAKEIIYSVNAMGPPGTSKVCDEFVQKTYSTMQELNYPPKDELKKIKSRKHEKVPRNAFSTKRKSTKKKKERLPLDGLWKSAVSNAPLHNLNSKRWSRLLTFNKAKVLLTAGQVYSGKKYTQFKEALNNAKDVWKCGTCTSYDSNRMRSGFIHCKICDAWFHQSCCPKYKGVVSAWQCPTPNCKARLDGEEPDDSEEESDYDALFDYGSDEEFQ